MPGDKDRIRIQHMLDRPSELSPLQAASQRNNFWTTKSSILPLSGSLRSLEKQPTISPTNSAKISLMFHGAKSQVFAIA